MMAATKNQTQATARVSLFKRRRQELATENTPKFDHYHFSSPSLSYTLSNDQIPRASLLWARALASDDQTVELEDIVALRDKDTTYILFNVLLNAYASDAKQQLDLNTCNKLRAACDALQINFEQTMSHCFEWPVEWERCVFTLRDGGSVGQLMFNNNRAVLMFIGDSAKICGLFKYSLDTGVIRLRDTACHGELELREVGDDLMLVQRRGTGAEKHFKFVNETPQRLCRAPALPSYYNINDSDSDDDNYL